MVEKQSSVENIAPLISEKTFWDNLYQEFGSKGP
jgi:hypothetical protein